MAIGKPLLVTERQGITRINPLNPVLTPQTKELSSNVAAQKIPLADYNIGMNNAQASSAVSEELVKMVGAGVKAQMYIDNTKQDYKRLNLMEEWQQSDMDYKSQFAKAMTPEDQEAVIADYDASLQQRTGNWRKSMGSDVESQKYLSSLRSGSQKQFSAFSTTHSQTVFKQTTDLHANNIARIAKSLTEDKNADVVSGFKTIQDTTESMVRMGAVLPEVAQFNFENLKDKIVTGRSTLFANDFAKEVTSGGSDVPTDTEFKARMEGVMGMPLGDRRLTLLRETFSDTYYKEIAEFNRQEDSEEKFAKKAAQDKLDLFEAEYKSEILDGTATEEFITNKVKSAKAFDNLYPGYSKKIESELRSLKWGAANTNFIEYFTEGEGSEAMRELAGHLGSKFMSLDDIEHLARTQTGEYSGMNEKTILGIKRWYREENDKVLSDTHKSSGSLLQATLMEARKNPAILDQDIAGEELWNAMAQSTSTNWERAFSNDPDYNIAYNKVKGLLAQHNENGTGPYSDKYMELPFDERIGIVRGYLQDKVAEVFGAVTKMKRDERKNKAEQAEKEEATIKAGKASKKMESALIPTQALGQAKQITSMSDEAGKNWTAMKSRVDSEIKRLDYEALSPWVKAIDEKIADLTPEVKIGPIKSMKEVASAMMGSTPTAFITGIKNKKLQAEIENQIGRPLTQDELAGKNETINKMSETFIERDTSSTIGRIWDWVVSDGNASEVELKLDNLTFELKNQSLKAIEKGIQSTQPEPEEQNQESLPVVNQPNTTANDLAQAVGKLLSPNEAGAASTFQDPNFDPAAPTGVRAFTGPDSKPLAVKPEEAKGATGEYPQYGEQYTGGTSEESDIENYLEGNVDTPPVVMDEIVVSEQANKPQGSTPEDLFDAQLKSDTSTPEVLQSRVGEAIKKIPRGSKNPQQIAQASMSIMPVLKLLAPVQTNVLTGYLTEDAPAHHMIAYGGRGAFYSAQNELGLLSPERKQNLTELEDFIANNAQGAFSRELKKIRTRLGMSVGDLTEHMKLIYMAETNVGTNVRDSTPTKPGDRPAIGNLQVMATTFKDLIGKQFGQDAATQAGLDYTELSKLKANNDLDGLEVLLRNKNVNFLAGMAKMIQYLEVKANAKKPKKKSKSVKGK